MTKDEWKIWYRVIRVERRERMKSMFDSMAYGTGFLRIDENGVRHVPLDEARDSGLT